MFGKTNKTQEITISNRTLLRVIAFIVGTIMLLNMFGSLRHPLTLIAVSIFLALAINPAVTWVAKRLKSRSRTRATTLAYLAVTTFLIGFFSIVVPPLVNQTRNFISDVPQIIRDLNDDEGRVGDFVRRYKMEEQITQLANDWSSDISNLQGPVVSLASRVVSNLVSIITVFVLTFMLLIEGPMWLASFWRQYPADRREHAKKIAYKMYVVIKSYANGQVVVATIGAAFSIVTLYIATTIFGVQTINPIAFGGLIFMFSLIPTIGAFLSAAVVVTFCLLVSVPLAVTMLVYFIVYQQIENTTIQPYIQSKGTELTPMLVFISAILGIGFGGVLGAFIAIPAAGCIKVLVDDYLDRRDAMPSSSSNKA